MGAAGSTSDAQIFNHTDFRHKIEDGSIGFPDSESLGIGGAKVNFLLFGDDAFPLILWLMRPYSSHTMDLKEMVFNYWSRRGRTVVENPVWILTSLFRIFQSCDTACLVLRNLLRIRYPTVPQEDFRGEGQHTIGLKGNEIVCEGCNVIGAAMNEGQLPCPMASS